MRALIVFSVLTAATAHATPARDGANHRLGDDSFVAAFGRLPDDGDGEKLRMRTHLTYVRGKLAERPPARPELATRRAELLGYLDDYITTGITPKNSRLPWRTPVFIDDRGAICAVGYLIERDVGRRVADRIARAHRYEFLEEIAAQMPDVRAWIDGSGFTLDELASIQPAYADPIHETWRTWDLARHAPPDGPFDRENQSGTFDKKSMHGTWTVKSDQGVVIGEGTLDHGTGTWKSYYDDGKRVLATGPYRRNKAEGAWTIYHASGNVAAKGMLANGKRVGEWTFYYDTKERVPLTRRRFYADGAEAAGWQLFDTHGKLLASRAPRGGVISVVADERGVSQRIDTHYLALTEMDGHSHELHRLTYKNEHFYVFDSGYSEKDLRFDAAGNLLERGDDGWIARDCRWAAKRKQVARSGDVAWLNLLLSKDAHARSVTKGEYGPQVMDDPGPSCGTPKLVDVASSKRLDLVFGQREIVRSPMPDFVRSLELGKDGTTETLDADDDTVEGRGIPAIPHLNSSHVDLRFEQVFRSMAGRYKWLWHSSAFDADGSDANENRMVEKDWKWR
jgi:hypothetical protein